MRERLTDLKVAIPLSRPDGQWHASTFAHFTAYRVPDSGDFTIIVDLHKTRAEFHDTMPESFGTTQALTHMYKQVHVLAKAMGAAADRLMRIINDCGGAFYVKRTHVDKYGFMRYQARGFNDLEIKINFPLDKSESYDIVDVNNQINKGVGYE